MVYHLGALASVARSVETRRSRHAACATGTLNPPRRGRQERRAAGRLRSQFQRYGGHFTRRANRKSLPAVAPKSPYAAAKLAGELLHASLRARTASKQSACGSLTSSVRGSGRIAPTVVSLRLFTAAMAAGRAGHSRRRHAITRLHFRRKRGASTDPRRGSPGRGRQRLQRRHRPQCELATNLSRD